MSPSSCWIVERIPIFGIGGDAQLSTSQSIEKKRSVQAAGVVERRRADVAEAFLGRAVLRVRPFQAWISSRPCSPPMSILIRNSIFIGQAAEAIAGALSIPC